MRRLLLFRLQLSHAAGIVCFGLMIALGHPVVAQQHPILEAPLRAAADDTISVDNKYIVSIADGSISVVHTVTPGTRLDSIALEAGMYTLNNIVIHSDSLAFTPEINNEADDLIELHIGPDRSAPAKIDSAVVSWSREILPDEVVQVAGREYVVLHSYPTLIPSSVPFVAGISSQTFSFVSNDPQSFAFSGRRDRLPRGSGIEHSYAISLPTASFGQYIVYGDLSRIEDRVLLPAGGAVDLEYVHTGEEQRDILQLFGSAPEAIRFFATSFGWHVDANSVRLVSIPGAEVGRYVRMTGLFDSEEDTETGNVLRTASSIAFTQLSERANLSAQDTWLFTGLPLYLGAMFVEVDRGEAAFDSIMQDLRDRLEDERRVYERPLFFERWFDPINVMDEHAFAHGAWTMHSLRHMLGDDKFGDVIGRLTNGSNELSSDNLTQILEDYLDDTQQARQREMFYTESIPQFDVAWTSAAAARTVVISVSPAAGSNSAPVPIDIAVETLTGVEVHTIVAGGSAVTEEFEVSGRPRYITVDPDGKLLATFHVEQTVSAWVASLRNAKRLSSRISAARALRQFVTDPALLIGLKSALRTETSDRVIQEILETVGQIPPTAAAEQTLIAYLGADSPGVRATAVRALESYTGQSESMSSIREMLTTERNEHVLAEAVRFISMTSSPDRQRTLQSALITQTPDDAVRIAGIRGLSRLDDATFSKSESARFLNQNYSDQVRIAALRVHASSLEGDQREQFVTPFLTDRRPSVRSAAAALLPTTVDDYGNKMRDILDAETDPRVRQDIRWVLYRNVE
ncbi:MAG: hypothetical protein HKN43_16245 [Rhodothermales bacterium]|nr:hypothetical protein [Rhodothermales bacterium]